MNGDEDFVERIVREVLARERRSASVGAARTVPVGVSNRHVHLSRSDMDVLFGPGSELRRKKAMKQPGQYAAEETVTLRGPKGSLEKVRVLGPLRGETQAEILIGDGFALGIAPPLRQSGRLEGTPGVEIVGPHGRLRIDAGLIAARRHVHMRPTTASAWGVGHGEDVEVEVEGERGGVMRKVSIRVSEAAADELHIDVEEANALGLRNGDLARIGS